MNNIPNPGGFPAENLEQMKHSAKLAEGEAELFGQQVQSKKKRDRAERKFILAIATHVFGPGITDDQKKVLNSYLAAHKEHSDDVNVFDGLQLHKFNATAAVYNAALQQVQEHVAHGITGGQKKVFIPGQ